jgi:hypothetical protein
MGSVGLEEQQRVLGTMTCGGVGAVTVGIAERRNRIER